MSDDKKERVRKLLNSLSESDKQLLRILIKKEQKRRKSKA